MDIGKEIAKAGERNVENPVLRTLISLACILPWLVLEMANPNGKPSDFGLAVGLVGGLTIVPLFSRKPPPLWHTALAGIGLLTIRLILSYPFHLALTR
jgi:ammonia channel protein AmtB